MMRWSTLSPRVSLAVVGLLVFLLVVLATLQYRWIAQVSEAERARLKTSLDQAAAGFCQDFDSEIARVSAHFNLEQPEDEAQLPWLLADRLRSWRSEAAWPGLIGQLSVVRHDTTDEIVLLCFDEEEQTLLRCDWDDGLLPIRRELRSQGRGVRVINGALPGMILVIEERRTSEASPPYDWRPPRDHIVIRFDLDFLTGTLFPRLAEEYFGGADELDYSLTISSARTPARIIFQAGPPAPVSAAEPDASGRIFGLRPLADFGEAGLAGQRPPRHPAADWGPPPRDRPQPQNPPPPRLHGRTEEGRWVACRPAPGGLPRRRWFRRPARRNMLISLVTLAMLGATALLMVLSTRSARRLARQQMDFVAAVSHELRTPLTAIRSAGQNLADGIIDDPDRVRSYGQLIEREGRRLTEMIGRVLTFAGIRSGRDSYRMAPVAVSEVVRASLEDRAWSLNEKGFDVHTEINDDVPPVTGDASALRQVVTNLVDNALKYAESGRWLGVSVASATTDGKAEVCISVSDHGPGIPKKERASVFEPFRRGADAAGSSIPGSGLGLAVVRSIVEAHDGSVEVAPAPGGGSTFVVRLPAGRLQGSEGGES